MIKFLDLAKQYQSLKPQIDAAIAGIIENSVFIGGSAVMALPTGDLRGRSTKGDLPGITRQFRWSGPTL